MEQDHLHLEHTVILAPFRKKVRRLTKGLDLIASPITLIGTEPEEGASLRPLLLVLVIMHLVFPVLAGGREHPFGSQRRSP